MSTQATFSPTKGLLMKLGSIVVHADEWTGENPHDVDREAIRGLLDDEEVQEWLKAMTELQLVPQKR